MDGGLLVDIDEVFPNEIPTCRITRSRHLDYIEEGILTT